jgi:F-type H+-transporting ATPase subunit b
MKQIVLSASLVAANPALAATGPFFTLHNTNFVVLLAFIVFVGILLKVKAPAKIAAMLDARAAQIRADLAEARALRDEARSLLSSYEKKQKEVQEQSERIIASAKEEAMAAAKQAKADLKASIARRMIAAEEQIVSAQAAAVRQVREQAVMVAVAAAGDLLAKQMTAESTSASIDAAIAQVAAKMH